MTLPGGVRRLALDVPEELFFGLKRRAAEEGKSVSQVVRRSLWRVARLEPAGGKQVREARRGEGARSVASGSGSVGGGGRGSVSAAAPAGPARDSRPVVVAGEGCGHPEVRVLSWGAVCSSCGVRVR